MTIWLSCLLMACSNEVDDEVSANLPHQMNDKADGKTDPGKYYSGKPRTINFVFLQYGIAADKKIVDSVKTAWFSKTPFKDYSESQKNMTFSFIEKVCFPSFSKKPSLSTYLSDVIECLEAAGQHQNGHKTVVLIDHLYEFIPPGTIDVYAVVIGDFIFCDYTKGLFGKLTHSLESTLVHEFGQLFGLCDEGYDEGGLDQLCSEKKYPSECPNQPSQNSLMCQQDICNYGCSPGDSFSLASYAFLEKAFACNSLIPNDKNFDCQTYFKTFRLVSRPDDLQDLLGL